MELVNGGAAFLAAPISCVPRGRRSPIWRARCGCRRADWPSPAAMVVFVLDVLDLVPWLEKRRLCDVPHL